jgi:hypothetical protein
MSDMLTVALYGLPAIVLSIGLAIWAERRFGIAHGRRPSMSIPKKPLKPHDFPVHSEGDQIKKQGGEPIAKAEDEPLADDVAERLNDDEARREQDKWSA